MVEEIVIDSMYHLPGHVTTYELDNGQAASITFTIARGTSTWVHTWDDPLMTPLYPHSPTLFENESIEKLREPSTSTTAAATISVKRTRYDPGREILIPVGHDWFENA